MKSEMPLEQSGCNSRTVPESMTAGELRATEKLCTLLIHPADYSVDAVETRRRINVIVQKVIFNPVGIHMEFSAETLARITAWFDATPKSLGYLYLQTLEREAKILIPEPIRYPLDKAELFNSVVNFSMNVQYLHCPQLIIGLSIMLFFSLRSFNMLPDGYSWEKYVDGITTTIYQR